ncbi:MAG: hypothetical protein RL695_1146 [Pseudomonadota bacterium]|jgi:hypothetical protein|nr:hypothetical protein [Rhodocyclaceae bacterium]
MKQYFQQPARRIKVIAIPALTGMFLSSVAGAVDLNSLATITGPLSTALTQLSSLGPGIKALVGFISFVVAFITLAALKNMGPVLFYIGAMIFGAVGLSIGGAILGAVI